MKLMRSRWVAMALVGTVAIPSAGCGGRFPRDRARNTQPLAPEVQQAVDDVMAQFTPAAEAFGAFFDGFEGIDFDGNGAFGECPIVTAAVADGVYSITLDYGAGCTNDYFGTNPASGSVALEYDSNTQSFLLAYDDLMVGDRAVNGSLDLDFSREQNLRSLTGSITLTTNSGSISGTLDMRFGLLTNTITINSAALTLTDPDNTSVSITVDSLVIRPVANESFVPESGTITFVVPNDGPGPDTLTIVVRFTSRSPSTGDVLVTVGNAPVVTYTIPGV